MADETPAVVTQTKEIAETTSQDTAEVAALEQINRANQENILQSEVLVTRFAIIQPQSPEVTDQIKGYAQGQIVDNKTREIISVLGLPPWLKGRVPDSQLEETNYCLIVPIFKLPSEFIKWKKRATEGVGMHWKTLDASDPRVRAGTWPPMGTWTSPSPEERSPPVTQNINVLCMCIDPVSRLPSSGFMVLTFAKTSFKAGQLFVSGCQQHAAAGLSAWFGRTYYLWTKKEKEGTQVWYEFHTSKGPETKEASKAAYGAALNISLQLSKPETGKQLQEIMINAAAIEEEHSQSQPLANPSDSKPGEVPF